MIRTLLTLAALVCLAACTPAQPPEPPSPSSILDVHPSDPTVRDGASCAVFYALSGKILGKDPDTVNRVAVRAIASHKITAIKDSFQREEYVRDLARTMAEHVSALPTTDLSLALWHLHDRSMVIGDYDFDRRGFKPAGLFFQDGHEQYFLKIRSTSGCKVKLRYAKPYSGYLLDVRYPVADQQVARAIESNRVNDNLVVRLAIEPIEVGEKYPEVVAMVKAIRFETKDGEFLGQADRLPGETKS